MHVNICRCDALYHFIFPCIIDQIYIFLSGPVLLAKLHQLCGLSFFKAQCTYPFQLEKDYGFVANIVLAWSSSVVWYLHLWLHLQLRGHVCSLVLGHSLRSRSPVSLFGSALEKALPPLFLLKYSRLFSPALPTLGTLAASLFENGLAMPSLGFCLYKKSRGSSLYIYLVNYACEYLQMRLVVSFYIPMYICPDIFTSFRPVLY